MANVIARTEARPSSSSGSSQLGNVLASLSPVQKPFRLARLPPGPSSTLRGLGKGLGFCVAAPAASCPPWCSDRALPHPCLPDLWSLSLCVSICNADLTASHQGFFSPSQTHLSRIRDNVLFNEALLAPPVPTDPHLIPSALLQVQPGLGSGDFLAHQAADS